MYMKKTHTFYPDYRSIRRANNINNPKTTKSLKRSPCPIFLPKKNPDKRGQSKHATCG